MFNSGNVNFFGPITPDVVAAAQAANYNGEIYTSTTSLSSLSAKLSRDLYMTKAGTIRTAFGVEGRREAYSTDVASIIQVGDVSGYGGNFLPVGADRKVGAAYAELVVPIIKNLEADLAVRYDHYEIVGGTSNPKVSLRWQPINEILLRGAYGKGFRAPALTDLFAPQTQSVSTNGLSDPLRCPTTNLSLDCQTQFTTVLGGNTGLRPERSESITAGMVFEPSKDLSIGLDVFKINLSNAIALGGIGADVILDDLTKYGSLVTRAAPDAAFPGLPGRITSTQQTNLNIGNIRLNGVDVDLKWRFYNGPKRQDDGASVRHLLQQVRRAEHRRDLFEPGRCGQRYQPGRDPALEAHRDARLRLRSVGRHRRAELAEELSRHGVERDRRRAHGRCLRDLRPAG